ncbi:MAG: hypothetical protein AAGP08_00815 [Pseudomonadota bacterium]
MKAILAIAAALVLSAQGAAADAREQLILSVSRDLSWYSDVDPNTLSTHQLASIKTILHSSRSVGYKRAHIRSTIGGRNSLRGVLGLGG